MMKDPVLQMGTDNTLLRHVFYETLTVRYPDRSERGKGSIPVKKGELIWCTE
jgi:hypothetical protein